MNMRAKLDALLQQATDGGAIPGVVALVADDKEVLYEGAAGLLSVDGDVPFACDTPVRLASMTKLITSVAAMQLVEQGKLQLDHPAAEVCPKLDTLQVLEGFDHTGKPQLRPRRGQVTLRQLLSHTAGMAYEFTDPRMQQWLQATNGPDVLSGAEVLFDRPLVSDPGTRWEYGMGTDWVGRMVEQVSGQRLSDYLSQHVFAPLGMAHTAFELPEADRARLAGVHARGPDGELAPIPFELPSDAEVQMGGHGLHGPVTDYMRLLRALLGNGALDGVRILGEESVAEMAKNQIGELQVLPVQSSLPQWSNDFDFFPGIEAKHGLGFVINQQDLPSGRAAGSLAWAGLLNSYFWIDPVRRRTGVLATQILPFFDARVRALLEAVERTVYSEMA